MNPLDLYREFSSTWERLRSDILAHFVLAGILYLCGYRLPDLGNSGFNPETIISSQWQAFLGSVGLPLTVAAFFALALVIYTSLLRGIGRAVGETAHGFLSTGSFNVLDEHARHELALIAASLPKDQFTTRTLEQTTYTLMEDVIANRPERVSAWLDDIGRRQGDRWTLFQDACFFPTAWLLLPLVNVTPATWTSGDGSPVLAFGLMCIFVVVAHNLLRFSSEKLGRERLRVTAYALETGEQREEIRQRLQDDYSEIRKVVDDFLKEKQRYRRRPPSLWRYLQHRWPRLRRAAVGARAQRIAVRRAWREFQHDASKFEHYRNRSQNYDDAAWLERYVQWRIARFIERVLFTIDWFWQRLRFY